MARELRRMGVRLTAEGVNQYKDDLRSAGREARLMSQETRLAMAELGTGASSTEKLTTRLKGLGREYDVQQNRVKTLTNSQKEFQTSLNLVGREVKTTSSQLKDSQRETNRLENNYRKMGETLGWNAEETKKAKAEWEASKNETKELANSLNALEKEQSQYTKELDKMPGKINSAKISMQEKANEMARLREEYIKNGGALGDYADTIEKTSQKVRTFSEGVTSVGDRLTMGVTVPIVTGVTAVVKAASDWESAFAGTKKTVDEVVDANGNVIYSYEQLEGELRNLSKQLPATHSEIAGVAEAAGQLGIETENVTSFTQTMIDMGESTNLSAEEAASSLARLANVTGMSQTDFDRLGSSVVALGNNFATTEAEVVEMGLRLAGTGNQVGMTESDIMGLAAAMSSMGIQAEAGGTAMSTVLKRMQNAVADGSEELEGFAKVAQMSASEFATAFEEDPARALQAFVEGLELSSEEGENLNAILGDLGITGIREADTLLRLAGNSELLGNALDMSSKGWEENSALAEEAGLRYETLESQLGMLRNEVYDIAIEFGGPFVQALRDAMQAARPMLETVSDMAKSFSELDEEQQQTIIKLIGITAAAGPALSILGRVGQGAATAGDGLAWLVRKIGGLQASAKTADPIIKNTGSTIEALGPIASTTAGSKGVGGLVTAVGTSLPWALGVAAVALGGWTLWKTWGEEAYEAGQRTKRWGTDVGEATDEALTSVQDSVQGALGQFGLMQQGINVDSDAMVGDFKKIGESIEDDINRRLKATENYLGNLPEVLRNSQQEILQDYQDQLNETLTITQENTTKVQEIQNKASAENRDLTKDENEYIRQLQNETLSEYIATLNLSAEEEKSIRQALTGDITQTTKEQGKQMLTLLAQQGDAMGKARRQAVEETQKYMEDHGISPDSKLGKELLQGTNDYYDALVVSGQRSMQELVALYPELIHEVDLATGKMLDRNSRDYEARVEMNRILLERWADSHRDMSKAAEEADQTNSYILDSNKRKYQEWNDIVIASGGSFDTFREKLLEAAQTTEGWNAIKLRIHDADLDSNAKAVIMEAAIMNGEWDGLEWGSKMALLKDNFSHTVYRALEADGTWDKLDWKERTALLNNEFTETVIQAMLDDGKWQELSWKERQAILTTNTPETLRQVLKDIGRWDTLPISVRNLLADKSQVDRTVDAAQRKLNSLRDKEVTLTVRNQTIYESIYRTRGSASSNNFVQAGGRVLHEATGTLFSPGGLTWLGDGGKREPYLTPSGEFGVSPSKDTLYNLERGTRVWPSRQSFRTSARNNGFLKQYLDQLPKFAKGGTIRNPYEGYTGLVGEAGPEIFQIAQGKVSITPISQTQRTKVLDNQGGSDMSQTNELLQTLIQLVAQGQVIKMDKVAVGRTIYDEVDSITNNNLSRSSVMSLKGGGA